MEATRGGKGLVLLPVVHGSTGIGFSTLPTCCIPGVILNEKVRPSSTGGDDSAKCAITYYHKIWELAFKNLNILVREVQNIQKRRKSGVRNIA